jgi:hypothetical protein
MQFHQASLRSAQATLQLQQPSLQLTQPPLRLKQSSLQLKWRALRMAQAMLHGSGAHDCGSARRMGIRAPGIAPTPSDIACQPHTFALLRLGDATC